MGRSTKTNKLYFALYFSLAIAGGFIAYQAMIWGPWAYSDSSAYIGAARNFSAGNGLNILESTGKYRAIKEFPPLFSILLSILGGSSLDYINTIRWLNIILFASSIFLFSQIIQYSTRKHFLTLLATILFIFSPQIVRTYTSAMSEPLFLFLLLSSLFVYQKIQNYRNRYLFALFIFISSLLPITRYAGFLFVGIYGIDLFINSKLKSLPQKIGNAILYYILAFLPLGVWGVSLIRKFSQFGGKNFSFGGMLIQSTIKSLLDEFKVLKLWIPYVDIYQGTIKGTIFTIAGSLFLITLFGWAINHFYKSKDELVTNKKHFFTLITLMILGYISFIGFTHSITVPQIDIIDRMMVPIYPLILICVFQCIVIILAKFKNTIFLSSFFIILFLIGLRYNIIRTYANTKFMQTNGEGFTAREYQQSGIIEAIRSIDADQEMISNSAGFVLFYSNRYPYQVDNFPYHTFGSGDSYGEKAFREKNAALIILFSDF